MIDVKNDRGVMNNGGEYGNLILQDLILPPSYSKPEVVAEYEKYAKRIHWLDSSVIPGSYQMNTSWYLKPNVFMIDQPTINGMNFLKPHKHEVNEIIGFYGTNPEDPLDLGGEIVFYIHGEKHVLTKSTMMSIPAGIEHAPLVVMRVDRPIFHFSIVMEDVYKSVNAEGRLFDTAVRQ